RVRGTPHPTASAEKPELPSPTRGEGMITRTARAALDHELRFTSARNAFTGFSDAGTRLRNASCRGAVLAWNSFIMAGGMVTTSMPPSVRRFRLSVSALSEAAQKSGSSFFASSSIAFWCAGENFFQVSLLTLTIWHDQV